MANKDDRSGVNPFTGKKSFDIINDDKFLQQCYNQYCGIINQSQLLDDTPAGQIVGNVSRNLISAVEDYLQKIGRIDYVQNYYDWEFHLVANNQVNAFCMPGGKIVMYSGILSVADTEEKVAFILGHEMAHALLDHSRTQMSNYQAKNAVTTATRVGGLALGLLGFGELGDVAYAAANVADIGSEFLYFKPFGRSQELEADKLGMMIIYLAGYNIQDIPSFWQSMSAQNANTHDFFSTHPSDSKRINAMNQIIQDINNNKDLYNMPILSDSTTPKDNVNNENNGIMNQISNISTTPNVAYSTSLNSNTTINKDTDNLQGKVKYCGNCGTPASLDSLFCTNCGHKFDMPLKCPNCGAQLEDGDMFCYNCGTKLQ